MNIIMGNRRGTVEQEIVVQASRLHRAAEAKTAAPQWQHPDRAGETPAPQGTKSFSSWPLIAAVVLAVATVAPALAAPVHLVRDGGSEFVIYYDDAAPASVAMAASELQEYVYQVSGAKLAIVHQPRRPMICLGENAASRAAGHAARSH